MSSHGTKKRTGGTSKALNRDTAGQLDADYVLHEEAYLLKKRGKQVHKPVTLPRLRFLDNPPKP